MTLACHSSGIRATCPTHRSLPCFIHFTISLYTWSNSLFMRCRLMPPFSLPSSIVRSPLRSKTPKDLRSTYLNVHDSWPNKAIGSISESCITRVFLRLPSTGIQLISQTEKGPIICRSLSSHIASSFIIARHQSTTCTTNSTTTSNFSPPSITSS